MKAPEGTAQTRTSATLGGHGGSSTSKMLNQSSINRTKATPLKGSDGTFDKRTFDSTIDAVHNRRSFTRQGGSEYGLKLAGASYINNSGHKQMLSFYSKDQGAPRVHKKKSSAALGSGRKEENGKQVSRSFIKKEILKSAKIMGAKQNPLFRDHSGTRNKSSERRCARSGYEKTLQAAPLPAQSFQGNAPMALKQSIPSAALTNRRDHSSSKKPRNESGAKK